jgi:hypothetical protein
MLWVTRTRIRVNRTATAWLVRRFIDSDASFCFVEPADVARVQRDRGAIGFDAPAAQYPHQDASGRCSFEALVERHCPMDRALRRLAGMVHRADFPHEHRRELGPAVAWDAFDTLALPVQRPTARPGEGIAAYPEAVGLRAISRGFPLIAADDHETVERTAFLYDALYASLRESQP